MNDNKRTALVVGATGLVGKELVGILLQSGTYRQVKVLVRNPTGIQHEKLVERKIDFERLMEYEDEFGADDVFCCLGTTIKKAGSQEAFKKVDYDYPLACAKMAKKSKQFLIISAIGADSKAKAFYSRVKGDLEKALLSMGLPALHIFRPSLLLGERHEFRFGENMAAILSPLISPLLKGKLKRFRPVQAKDLAQAMYVCAKEERKGHHVYEGSQIFEMAGK